MDNQHKHIKGYRDLSEDEIALMNEAKDLSERVGALVTKVRLGGDGEIDQRWVSIGATNLQLGFMALIRAIAKPTTF